jgi:hypothetical protein
MVVSQVVNQVVVKVRQGARCATDWWRPWFVGEKGGGRLSRTARGGFEIPG